MTVRKILQYPDNELLLRQTSAKVRTVDRGVLKLIEDLKESLEHDGGGSGLAAPQVGVRVRVIVVKLHKGDNELQPPLALINPEIELAGPPEKGFDGCLSIPGIVTWDIPRPSSLVLFALGEDGKLMQLEVRGADARLVHHELDHLDGILFIDRAKDWKTVYRVVRTEEGEKLISLADLASAATE